jgi:serine protease AprX
MVSGAAALLVQKEPSLVPDQVKARLMRTATKTFPMYSTVLDPATGKIYETQYDIFTVGAGYLDVWAALTNTENAPALLGSAASPTAVLDTATNTIRIVNTQLAVWGDSAVWGDAKNAGFSAVWGDSAVWGASTLVTETTGIIITGDPVK